MPKITRAAGATFEGDPPPIDPNQTAIEDEVASADPDAYEPGDYTVSDVNAYLDECRADGNTDEAGRVLELERAGRNRAGIVNRA